MYFSIAGFVGLVGAAVLFADVTPSQEESPDRREWNANIFEASGLQSVRVDGTVSLAFDFGTVDGRDLRLDAKGQHAQLDDVRIQTHNGTLDIAAKQAKYRSDEKTIQLSDATLRAASRSGVALKSFSAASAVVHVSPSGRIEFGDAEGRFDVEGKGETSFRAESATLEFEKGTDARVKSLTLLKPTLKGFGVSLRSMRIRLDFDDQGS